MSLHCFINICVRLLTAGWYVVKRQNPLVNLFFCVKADGPEAKLTSESDLSIIVFGYPRVVRRVCLIPQKT